MRINKRAVFTAALLVAVALPVFAGPAVPVPVPPPDVSDGSVTPHWVMDVSGAIDWITNYIVANW